MFFDDSKETAMPGETTSDDGAHNAQPPRHAYPLAVAAEGELLRIAAIDPGKRFQHRLLDLGLAVGAEIRIVRRGGDGPLLIGINDTRLALGHGMAAKILVVPA